MKSNLHVAIFGLTVLSLWSCHQKDSFHSISIGSILGNAESFYEFSIPEHEGDLVAISGRIADDHTDIDAIISHVVFDIKFFYENGASMEQSEVNPQPVIWHGSNRGFVIPCSDIYRPKDGRVVRIKVRMRVTQSEAAHLLEDSEIILYAGAISPSL